MYEHVQATALNKTLFHSNCFFLTIAIDFAAIAVYIRMSSPPGEKIKIPRDHAPVNRSIICRPWLATHMKARQIFTRAFVILNRYCNGKKIEESLDS